MADSQKFPVAAHALAYLAHCGAMSPEAAVSSVELAASIPTNPVVIRRVTGMLAQAGLVATRAAIALADRAAAERLSTITVADLLAETPQGVRPQSCA